MEIVISIWILWALAVGLIICYFTHARLINNLKSTVDKQHQYIDKILAFNKTQSVVNKDLVDISKDIANKVISIEERVDVDSERIKTLEMGLRVVNYKNDNK